MADRRGVSSRGMRNSIRLAARSKPTCTWEAADKAEAIRDQAGAAHAAVKQFRLA